MSLAGGLLLLLILHLLIIPDGALSATAAAAGRGCQRRCGGLLVPYPFGFSGSCPIKLACNESSATPAALMVSSSTSEEAAADRSPYTVVRFNATASTFVVSLPPSCDRTVSGARRWLAGANYGVSSRTGLFLRGCLNATTTNCSVPVETMLRTTRCGNETSTSSSSSSSSLTCVASLSADSTAAAAAAAAGRGEGLFMKWERVEEPRCGNLMTSVYGDTRDGVFSLEFAMAEMGWWVNGSCSNHTAGGSGGGVDDLGRCAANATCVPVQTPTGEWAHRCECLPGMDGDGFAAGEGCFFSVERFGKKFEK
uniref:Wall-associated receptor kinase galacturonan-binding domain-containing protein n=1 Tax=Oryza glumipatula TaxID=40148 RepID=A0A0E0BUS8_9ORYZ